MATLERNEAGRGRFGRVGCGKQALTNFLRQSSFSLRIGEIKSDVRIRAATYCAGWDEDKNGFPMKLFTDVGRLEPEVYEGQLVVCPHCLGKHKLLANNGALLLFYECGGEMRLGAVAGKLVVGEV